MWPWPPEIFFFFFGWTLGQSDRYFPLHSSGDSVPSVSIHLATTSVSIYLEIAFVYIHLGTYFGPCLEPFFLKAAAFIIFKILSLGRLGGWCVWGVCVGGGVGGGRRVREEF